MLNCGIIGFGGLGKAHFKNITAMEDIKLLALCDINEAAFATSTGTNLGEDEGVAELSGYRLYTDYNELLKNEKLDFVIIAVPTYLHAEIAIAALEAGVNAFCEKPMSRSADECQRMLEAARKNKKRLMLGQCLRFWPEYVYLKEAIDSGKYGRVVRAEFTRQSAPPIWGWQNWFMNFEKSGGAALDMHIHDVDAILWLFGAPQAVTSQATHVVSRFDSIHTNYHYPDKIVTALGDWGMTEAHGFRMAFCVRLEKAVILMNSQGLAIYAGKETLTPELPKKDAYFEEMREFIALIRENRASGVNPPEGSADAVKLALLEMASAESGERVEV